MILDYQHAGCEFQLYRNYGGHIIMHAQASPIYALLELAAPNAKWYASIPWDILKPHALSIPKTYSHQSLDQVLQQTANLIQDIIAADILDNWAAEYCALATTRWELEYGSPDAILSETGLHMPGDGVFRDRVQHTVQGKPYEFVHERSLSGSLQITLRGWRNMVCTLSPTAPMSLFRRVGHLIQSVAEDEQPMVKPGAVRSHIESAHTQLLFVCDNPHAFNKVDLHNDTVDRILQQQRRQEKTIVEALHKVGLASSPYSDMDRNLEPTQIPLWDSMHV